MRIDEVCKKYKFLKHDHTLIFYEFLSQAASIPKEDWIFVLLDMHTRASMNVELFRIYLQGALRYETESDRNKRIEHNRKSLEGHIDSNGMIKVYRGCGERSAKEKIAISYTVSREVAVWFANKRKLLGDKKTKVIEKTINFEDVVYYTNEREEQEIILLL